MDEKREETGFVSVEKIEGKTTVTRCFSKYPLKLIVPRKGDRIFVGLKVGVGCTMALTTQASTKVYKAVDSKCSEQILEAKVQRNGLLAVIPDPVTCFSNAIYSQKQFFWVSSDSNLVVVDWITSGRHESGEIWNFELYKSSNKIFLDANEPLFIDSVLLEQASTVTVAERMKDYQVVAMIIVMGPKLKPIQDLIQMEVKSLMSPYFRPTTARKMSSDSTHGPSRPPLFASCSLFGPEAGIVVRLLSTTTEAVYSFLRHHLASLEQFLGAPPYRNR